MAEQVFETKITNHLPVVYPVYELNGEVITTIASKGWMIVASENPRTLYARWDQIDIFKDYVKLSERPNWREPDRGQFVLDCVNEDGSDLEHRVIGGLPLALPRGIPVKVGISLDSPWIWYQKLEIRRVWERRKDEHFSGYFVRVPTTKDVKTERPETEIYWILGAMKDQGIEPPDREIPAVEEKAFETVFENKTDQPVKVWADNGMAFFAVGPGRSVILEAFDPKVIYARYKKVTFKKGGKIDVDENRHWKNPFDLSIELINLEGAATESVLLAGQHINVVRNIPRFAEVHLSEEDVFKKSFTWKKIMVKRERPSLPGYFDLVEEIRCIKELRSEREIKALREQRAALVDKKAEKEKAKILEGRR